MNVSCEGAIRLNLFAAALGLLLPLAARADALSLQAAERLAVSSDALILSARAEHTAMNEMAVAARQLEDPKVRLGLLSLPVDTFHLGQEPMTQVQVGIQQKFFRGDSRELRGVRYEHLAGRQQAMSAERERAIRQKVRQHYLDVMLEIRMLEILEQSADLFGKLADLAVDYYATGRGQQEDVLNARLEQARIADRLVRGRQNLEAARSRLSASIGDDAWLAFPEEWPELAMVPARASLAAELNAHPRLLALRKQIEFAQAGEDLARQRYKPDLTLDVAYGGRGGTNPDGSSRPDFLSVMLTMDVPLFTSKRQDRLMAARVAETQSVTYARDDVYRQMAAEVDLHLRSLQRIDQRLELYSSGLLPQAREYAEASFSAYQDATGDLVSLVRAWITEYELRIDHARLQAEALKTRAKLLYFSGESS
jgi:outer membrane protein TolC